MEKPFSDIEGCIQGMVKGNTISTLREEECQEIIKAITTRLLPDLVRKTLTTNFIEEKVKDYLTSEEGKETLTALIQDVLVVRVKDMVSDEQVEPLLRNLTPKVLDKVLASNELNEHVSKIANGAIESSVFTKIIPHLPKQQDMNSQELESSGPSNAVAQTMIENVITNSGPVTALPAESDALPQSEGSIQPAEPAKTAKKSLGQTLFGPLPTGADEEFFTPPVAQNGETRAADAMDVDSPSPLHSKPQAIINASKASKTGAPASKKDSAKTNNESSSPAKGSKTLVKRKAGAKDSVTDDDTPAPAKKTRIRKPPPGHATGPDIKFSMDATPKLSGTKRPCGKPRLIDTESFREDTNMATSNMQDVVATILWKHDPESIKCIIENDRARYQYIMYDSNDRQKNFAVYKVKVGEGAEVSVGKVDLSELKESGEEEVIKWQERVTYNVSSDQKWVAKAFELRDDKGDQTDGTGHKTSVKVKAMDMGRAWLLEKIWADKERFEGRVLLT